MIIAVDIDGIITIETEGWGNEIYAKRTPNTATIKVIKNLRKDGHTITLFTARFTKDREATEKWLTEHGVEYDSLVMGKLQYDALIDDRAFNSFGEFYSRHSLFKKP